jgi:hypothetical protein
MQHKEQGGKPDAQKLRDLASWYREFAERAGSSMIWASRLHMAEELDQEAGRLERRGQPASLAEALRDRNRRRADRKP